MTHTDLSAIQRALARSDLYRWLAALFLPPDSALADTLRPERAGPMLQEAARLMGEPYAAGLPASCEVLCQAVQHLDLQGWVDLHLEVFGHTMPREAAPYETEYGAAHIFMQAHQLADIAAFYRAFGLEITQGVERLDHLAVELEFMAFLCLKEAYALDRGHEAARVAVVRDGQRLFLREHLGRWAPAFCQRLQRKTGGGFYGALAQVVLRFLALELEVLAVPATPLSTPEARSDDAWEPACESCAWAGPAGQ